MYVPDDPFDIFRTTLFLALTAYYALTTAMTVWHLAVLLGGSDPRKRILRVYLSYQLVSFRIRPLVSELIQIAILTLILLVLWQLHV